MIEFTLVNIALLVAVLLVGVFLGWVYRSKRSNREKVAISAGWQAQLDSQQSEHDRLADQNQSLMEQINQYQASNKDAKMRAKELSDSLRETFTRRDELQTQMKEIRGNLEVAIAQRDNLKSDVHANSLRGEETEESLREKDLELEKLKKSLASWQQRVPPLVERYRQRDLEAQQLEVELRKANEHIATLESMARGEHTRIEPVDGSIVPNGLDASNDSHNQTSAHALQELADQIDANSPVDFNTDDQQKTAFPNVLNVNYAQGMGEEDDLKKIKGIGPAIEKTLNSLGIHRFNQIAEISEYDIDRVALQLKGFRSRIYREDWIGQARLLQHRKNNDTQPV